MIGTLGKAVLRLNWLPIQAVGEDVNEAVTIQGHEIRFATVDLAASAVEIRKQLLRAIGVSHDA